MALGDRLNVEQPGHRKLHWHHGRWAGSLGNDIGIAIGGVQNSIGATRTEQAISSRATSGTFNPGANFHNVRRQRDWTRRANTTNGIDVLSGANPHRKRISANGDDGILVSQTVVGVNISDNLISANGALGIDLLGGAEDSFGVSANDNGDLDPGANQLQNYPVLTLAHRDLSAGTAIVRGTLNSTASTQFRVDIYLAAVDASGHGEGQVLLASGTVTTDSGGDKTFTFTINSLAVGQVVTATATALTTGNTSEFSREQDRDARSVAGLPSRRRRTIHVQPTAASCSRIGVDARRLRDGCHAGGCARLDHLRGQQDGRRGRSETLRDGKCDVSTASGKQCTLRAAIQQANATAGADTINFKITSASKVIKPATPLPAITEKVTIDGYSQSGAAENTLAVGTNAVLKVVLDGVNAGTASGLDLASPGSVVKGLNIQRFTVGIRVSGADFDSESNTVRGNYIGTNAAGTQARANLVGIRIERFHTVIGGFDAAARNIISGNDGIGIDSGEDFNVVQGNYIGVDATGAAALGNTGTGVSIAANSNTIGGATAALRNVISANGGNGVTIGAGSFNFVIGNRIGTKADGTGDLGNDGDGVFIFGGNNHRLGGSGASGNVISGNSHVGVHIGNLISGTVIQGNAITANDEAGIVATSGSLTIGGNVDPRQWRHRHSR